MPAYDPPSLYLGLAVAAIAARPQSGAYSPQSLAERSSGHDHQGNRGPAKGSGHHRSEWHRRRGSKARRTRHTPGDPWQKNGSGRPARGLARDARRRSGAVAERPKALLPRSVSGAIAACMVGGFVVFPAGYMPIDWGSKLILDLIAAGLLVKLGQRIACRKEE
jgi:hypothetical protein